MNSQNVSLGRLYLVPSPLDFGCEVNLQIPLAEVLPSSTLQIASQLQYWVSENAKSTRAFLKRVDATNPLRSSIQALQIQELPRAIHKKGDHDPRENPSDFDAKTLLMAALPANGAHDIGLVSEAGMPAIADPGASVVRAAHSLGMPVVPLVGPVSLLLALAASGLNGQNFAFVGYLAQDAAARVQRIQSLEALALQTGQTQLFIETPYRNATLAAALLQSLNPATRLCFASGLTMANAQVQCKSVKAWREQPLQFFKDTPTVFALGR